MSDAIEDSLDRVGPVVLRASDPALAAATEADCFLAPDVALLIFPAGNGFLLDLADRFYALSPVAMTMLRASLQQPRQRTLDTLVRRYEIDRSVVEADLVGLLDALRTRGAIRARSDPPRPALRSRGADFTAWIVRLCVATRLGLRARAAIALTLARVSFAAFGWGATLASWRVLLASPAEERRAVDEGTSSEIHAAICAIAAVLPFIGGNCKERALASLALARRGGVSAKVVVGVMSNPLSAHTWCEAGATIIGDERHNCRRYVPVFRYE